MSVEEQLVARLRDANPEPNYAATPDIALVALLNDIDRRNQTMTMTDSKTMIVEPTPPVRRRGALVAAAAFVVVLLIGAALLVPSLVGSSPVADDDPLPPADADALQLVQDLAGAMSGTAELPPIGPDAAFDDDPLDVYAGFATTMSTTVELTGCAVANETVVTCKGVRTNVVLDAMGVEETATWTLLVQDGAIAALSREFDDDGAIRYFSESGRTIAFEEDYVLWLDSRHPEWRQAATGDAIDLTFDDVTGAVMLGFVDEYAAEVAEVGPPPSPYFGRWTS
ncbi:MAG: hypothetical protein U9N84_13935 [Actinomycetota bacterium]|nr:hypothetical protein [Actinomycetota bacterium]